MRLAQNQPGEGLVEMELESSKEEFFVSRTVSVSIADVASAKIVNDAAGGFLVRITFLPASKKKVEEFTEKNIDRNVALFVNGKLFSAPRLRTKISGSLDISGLRDREAAERFVRAIEKK